MLIIKQLTAGILKQLDLTIKKGDCLAVCGDSGSGKTTLLNAVAGNINYHGEIHIAGSVIDSLPAWRRPCRYLNQRLYLFPHLTIENNLRLAQYAARLPQQRQNRMNLLGQLGIAHLAHRYPQQISGGEQQRAALARALISQPSLLLLDEPFSSLDWPLRQNLWQLINNIRECYQLTILLVTHEPKEADALATHQLKLIHGVLSTGE